MRGGAIYIQSNKLHWLAGLLEAEGCFITGSPCEPRTPTALINMTDRDVMQVVADCFGSTVMNQPVAADRKAMYRTSLRGGSAVSLMKLIQPLMGIRRQQQIERAIACRKPINRYPHREYIAVEDAEPEHDRYWLAGYLEGEGSFSLHTNVRPRKTYYYPLVQLNSTDEDIVERVRLLCQRYTPGEINIGRYQPAYEGSKIQYHIGVKGTRARLIMEDLYPLLYSRRQSQIRSILSATTIVARQ